MQSRCPKCDGSMSGGFLLDEGHGYYRVSRWQSGEPKKSIWTGIKQRKSDQLQVSTRRCDRYGFLELYALAQ